MSVTASRAIQPFYLSATRLFAAALTGVLVPPATSSCLRAIKASATRFADAFARRYLVGRFVILIFPPFVCLSRFAPCPPVPRFSLPPRHFYQIAGQRTAPSQIELYGHLGLW